MPRPHWKGILDLGNRDLKRRFLAWAGALAGIYEITVQPKRNTRTLRQNAWYWGCLCTPLADFLRQSGIDVNSAEEAHEILKDRFLKVDVFHPETGELIGQRRRSTTELSTEEMAEYCEKCRDWMADYFNIIVPDPDPEWSSKPKAVAHE